MIQIKSAQQIEIMRAGGKILAHVLKLVGAAVRPGIGTKKLNQIAEQEIIQAGGFPIFKGYHGFPTGLCVSVDDEVVHGPALPNRQLQEGSLVGLDLGIRYPAKNGLITDMAVSVPVGKISPAAQKLLQVTESVLYAAVQNIKAGIHLGDISFAIQTAVEKNGFNVVRELVGHGVGKKLHEEPQIPNYGLLGSGPILASGMTLAIEPMVVAGDFDLIIDPQNKAYKTADGSLSAHFEHTILVTEHGFEILTQ